MVRAKSCTECGGEVDITDRYCRACGAVLKPPTKDSATDFSDSTLPREKQLLLDIVESSGEVTPRTLYKRYASRVEAPKSRRTIRKYLADLADQGLIRAVGEKRGRKYAVAQKAPIPEKDDDPTVAELVERLP